MDLSAVRRRLRARPAGRLGLWALSCLYGAGVWLRQLAYDSGLKPSHKLPARTICIGNLTAGGTGKTPAVLLAARELREAGASVAILTRGYRAKRVPRGKRKLRVLFKQAPPWEEVGDEPWMMHEALKDLEVPILVSPDRVRAGRAALRHYRPQYLILDDGFQHLRLRRDADIVLLSALDPFGGEGLLPLGNLREPARGLRRAQLAVITHSDRVAAEALAAIRARIAEICPALPVAEAAHRPDHLLDLKTDARLPLERLRGVEAACVSGLGEPRGFEECLRGLGCTLNQTWRFPDHHAYGLAELRSIENVRRGAPLITTFKDRTRFPEGWRTILTGDVLALAVRMEIVRGRNLWEAALHGEKPSS